MSNDYYSDEEERECESTPNVLAETIRLVSILKYNREDVQVYLEGGIGDIVVCSTDEEAKRLNANGRTPVSRANSMGLFYT